MQDISQSRDRSWVPSIGRCKSTDLFWSWKRAPYMSPSLTQNTHKNKLSLPSFFGVMNVMTIRNWPVIVDHLPFFSEIYSCYSLTENALFQILQLIQSHFTLPYTECSIFFSAIERPGFNGSWTHNSLQPEPNQRQVWLAWCQVIYNSCML